MIGIAFQGAACRAAFHAGVAAALYEGGMRFPMAAGASSGSLCATGVAAGRAAELPAQWSALAGRRLISLRRALYNRSLLDMSHIVRSTLRSILGDGDLRGAPGEALVVASRFPRLRRIVYSSRQEADFVEPLLGSCFFPVLYGRTVRVRGDWLVDGGLLDNVPIDPLVDRGCDEVITVVTRPDGTALKTPWRRRWRPHHPHARVHVIHPRRPLELGSWDFDPDRIRRAVDEGLHAGRVFLSTVR
jgi:NTE family protein